MIDYKKISNYLKHQDWLSLVIGGNLLIFLTSQIFIAFNWFSLRQVALQPDFDRYHWWQILTYGLFHQGLLAVFFNMLLLFYFGRILLDFKSEKKFLILYISGIILGGVFFVVSNKLFHNFYVEKTPLLGASAGVMAVITYISMLLPHYQIKIRFLGYFKLIYLLIFLIIFNLLQIPLGNPGGYFAHLGGLIAGFLLFIFDKIISEKPKKDIFDVPKSQQSNSHRIDTILEKISRSGYDSLTQAEKEELFKQSQK